MLIRQCTLNWRTIWWGCCWCAMSWYVISLIRWCLFVYLFVCSYYCMYSVPLSLLVPAGCQQCHSWWLPASFRHILLYFRYHRWLPSAQSQEWWTQKEVWLAEVWCEESGGGGVWYLHQGTEARELNLCTSAYVYCILELAELHSHLRIKYYHQWTSNFTLPVATSTSTFTF